MVLKQLFVSKPPIELLNNIIKSFGLKNLNDTKEFSYIDMNKIDTLKNFKNLENEINIIYLVKKKNILIILIL